MTIVDNGGNSLLDHKKSQMENGKTRLEKPTQKKLYFLLERALFSNDHDTVVVEISNLTAYLR